jgi:rare lipoprotein A (peptidoglycan hydrolase)
MPIQRGLPGMVVSAIALLLPMAAEAGSRDVGVATWYGGAHNGNRTSSGAIFNQNAMTAASSRVPLGTKVRVTMQDSGNSVVVLVNDRMGGRAMIDLSRAAAKQIGLYARGRAVVAVEPTADEPIEVAEATEDETADIVSSAPRGRRHTRHDGRWAAADHRCCHAPSVVLARHSVQPRVVRRRL